jgi:hypothetical protein
LWIAIDPANVCLIPSQCQAVTSLRHRIRYRHTTDRWDFTLSLFQNGSSKLSFVICPASTSLQKILL